MELKSYEELRAGDLCVMSVDIDHSVLIGHKRLFLANDVIKKKAKILCVFLSIEETFNGPLTIKNYWFYTAELGPVWQYNMGRIEVICRV